MAIDFSRKSVLVVDDFQNMRSTLRKMLQAIGVDEIEAVGRGSDAIKAMQKNRFDIILCDYNLGEGQDGQQVLEEAKAKKLIGISSLFVMITAENTIEMVMAAMEYKPDGYLTKPFTKDLLKARLEKLLERKVNFRHIEEAVANHDYDKALLACNKLIADSPRNLGEILRTKLDILFWAGDIDGASQLCEKVLAQREVPWARLGIGKAQFLSGQYEAAQETLTALVEQHRNLMEAHDLLAMTLEKLGDLPAAQKVLTEATEMSPRAIKRQQTLGNVAERNEDLTTAERAYRKTIAIGRDSIYGTPDNYVNLAKIQTRTASPMDAMRTISNMKKQYKDDRQATLQATLGASDVYDAMGKEDESQKAFDEAAQMLDEMGDVPANLQLAVARGHLLRGDTQKGKSLISEIVLNNHENEALLGAAQEAFKDADMDEEGARIIADSRGEVVRLNNEGVSLVKENKLEEAIALFEEAAMRMPGNKTVNLNAAQVLLRKMQKQGVDPELMDKTNTYLTRARDKDPDSSTYRKLLELFNSLRQ